VRKVANIVRIIFGFVLLAGAAANAYLTLTQPEVYVTFADTALIPLYRNLWQTLVVPYLRFWLALVIVLELTLAVLILSKGKWVKVGLVSAIIFFLLLVPFWWEGGAIINIVFALILALPLRYNYHSSIIDLLKPGEQSKES